MGAELVRLEEAELGLGHPVVPGERDGLLLDERPRRPRPEGLEHPEDAITPFEGGHLAMRPHLAVRGARPEAVLGVEADGERSEALLHELARAAAHEVHRRLRSLGEALEQREETFVGTREIGDAGGRNEGAVVAEDEEELLRGADPLDDLGELPGAGHRESEAAVVGARLLEALEEGVGPLVDVVQEATRLRSARMRRRRSASPR